MVPKAAEITMSKTGVLLTNLGSPDSTDTGDVRTYLREFLSDPRVIDIPAPIRSAILNLAILPFRPRKSAEAYEKVWTDEGSPLIISTERICEKLSNRIDVPIEIGMRYGNPSTASGIEKLLAQGVTQIFLVPLYPHYAMSSYETGVVKVREELERIAPDVDLWVQPPFYQDEDYIAALAEQARPHLEKDFDVLLFSYHGIPERHLRKTDPSHAYCLEDARCCEKANPAHATCYRAQCYATSRAFAEHVGLAREKWHVSFQSRLGNDPWLKPYTDLELEAFPSRGFKKILVMCPAFISDCLETLEEIAMEGHEIFEEAGGHEFTYIPCLNESDPWIEVLERFVSDFEDGRLRAA